jgi:siroheme synthase-like protein
LLSIVLRTDNSTLAVVVGAGAVGLRKCTLLQAAGLRVRLVDPLLETVPDGVEVVRQEYHRNFLAGALMVVVCTNRSDVNARVVADALAQHQLVCDTTDPSRGNFVFPATWSSGPIQLSVSTGGAAPSLAIRLARQLGESLEPTLPAFVELLAELRAEVLRRLTDEATRREWLRHFASTEFQRRVKTNGVELVRAEVIREIASEPAT